MFGQQNILLEQSALEAQVQQVPSDPAGLGAGAGTGAGQPQVPPHCSFTNE